jgi:hypothetical protein
MSGVAPNAGIIDFGEFVSASAGGAALPGYLPAPKPGEEGYVFTTNGWTDPTVVASGATFEYVAKNIKSESYTLSYSDGLLTAISYANGVTKTLGYTDGALTTITLSGATPANIKLIKTLLYAGGVLSGVSYA